MASIKDFFTSMYSDSVPTIRMGDDSKIQAKRIGKIDLDDRYFNNVLFVPDLAVNLLTVYQINHVGEYKRVTFTSDTMDIVDISTNKVVALGYVDHQASM